jgi:micrococcal nuclease
MQYRNDADNDRMTWREILLAAALVLLVSLPLDGDAGTLVQGEVVKVVDGDTIDVLDASKQVHRIRFAWTDAPERTQPFYAKAKDALGDLVHRKQVTVDIVKTDIYKRFVGSVYLDGQDVGLALVRQGMVWHNAKYEHEMKPDLRSQYRAAEQSARTERRGLWVDPAPVPPWEFRKDSRAGASAMPNAHAGSPTHSKRSSQWTSF